MWYRMHVRCVLVVELPTHYIVSILVDSQQSVDSQGREVVVQVSSGTKARQRCRSKQLIRQWGLRFVTSLVGDLACRAQVVELLESGYVVVQRHKM